MQHVESYRRWAAAGVVGSTRCLVSLLFLLTAAALGGDAITSSHERATALRNLRDQISSTPAGNADLYERYLGAFPASFTELGELFAVDTHREALLRPGETWDYGQPYVVLMCQTYDHVDHRSYMRHVLRIGVGANDWGIHRDDLRYRYAGDIYQRLIARYPCSTPTEALHAEQTSVIYSVLPEFTDTEFEAIYNSLAWVEAEDKIVLDWFLQGACDHDSTRCELTQALRKKAVKSPGSLN